MHVDSHLSSLLFLLLNHYQVIELRGVGTIKRHQISARLIEAEDEHLLEPPLTCFLFTSDKKTSTNTLLRARSDELLSDDDYNSLLTFVNDLNKESQSNPSLVIEREQTIANYFPDVKLNEHNDVLQIKPNETDNNVTTQVTQTSDHIINKAQNLPTQTTDKKVVLDATDEKSWLDYLLPLSLLIAGMVLITVLYKLFMKDVSTTSHQKREQKELIRADDDIDPLIIDEPAKIFDNPRLEKYRHVLTKEIIADGCKITVGSFKDEANAINMMERVLTEGYNSEIVSFEAGIRVIITFDCLSEDLDLYLTEVKETIAPNAWYLQPEYEPESN